MAVVSVEHLTKLYSNHRGINDISFSINKGEVLGLLGPNGSGKTTTMKVMTSLLKSYKGKVNIFDSDINDDYPKIMAKTGCLIEQPGLYPYLTAVQNLRIAGRFYPDVNLSRINEMLEIVELSKYKNEKVQKFSMGMKQRLAFAIALISKPELMILDEPTNGMDIGGTALVRHILKSETKKGCAILISSHLAYEMEQLCTHVAILEEGSMIDCESVDKVVSEYGSVEKYYLDVTKKRKEN